MTLKKDNSIKAQELRQNILELTREYTHLVHGKSFIDDSIREAEWVPGVPIPYAGRIFESEEVVAAVNSSLDFWLTLGVQGREFENELCQFLGVKASILVNSGSSANLIALSTLTSSELKQSKRLCKGDEVITVAAGFPTTVAPILQVGCIPVFIDADPLNGNVDTSLLYSAYKEGKTKAVILAHALGNPFDIKSVLEFCRTYDLWLIEDNCDSLGSTYSMPVEDAKRLGFSQNSPGLSVIDGLVTRFTGTWGDISTQSFYPPHHITMGEGGAVNIISKVYLKKLAKSFRDWGRDCWCDSGEDNRCGKRFEWSLGDLPTGYDHKYIYSHLGYNLKPLDIQAAIGRVQLNRLSDFNAKRKANWEYLYNGLKKYSDFLELGLPTHATSYLGSGCFEWDATKCITEPAWFGFKISVKHSAPFSRLDLSKMLDGKNIGHRALFGGNLIRQPAFVDQFKINPNSIRISGQLIGSDQLMNDTIFIGTYPGLTGDQLRYIVNCISEFVVSATQVN